MMARYTTFAHDLALIGGQDKHTARGLSWEDFVSHWSSEAESLPLQPRWSTHAKKLVWRKAWRVPQEWGTATWPDFYPVSQGTKNHDEAVQAPLTVLHMALVDHIKDISGAAEAFDFLLSCGLDSNVWPGHGGSVIATACSQGHLPSLSSLLSHGHDFQATLGPDMRSRPEFRGSCLLHRVGKSLAKKSQWKGAGKAHARAARRTLEFLVEHMPDPMATDAQGNRALDVVLGVAPELSPILTPIWLKRSQQWIALELGYDSELSSDIAQVARENRSWALKGKAQANGEPLTFMAPAGFSLGEGPAVPFSLTPLDSDQAQPEAILLRADKIARSRGDLDASEALALARESGAEAVVCRKGSEEIWWAFHPRQVRPALIPTPAPSTRPPSPRL